MRGVSSVQIEYLDKKINRRRGIQIAATYKDLVVTDWMDTSRQPVIPILHDWPKADLHYPAIMRRCGPSKVIFAALL